MQNSFIIYRKQNNDNIFIAQHSGDFMDMLSFISKDKKIQAYRSSVYTLVDGKEIKLFD
ncbi:hypothetical protein [Latilactobacillus sakei]|uniref:hypothetical protein n=1 Tax=Latilactobacillus sakei TaxID=1599 RepID=UPI0015F5238A|nr:hypothetical protein [Latilactobacillus sakei]QMU86155.1 hypothetical protein H3M14_08700 [Latilactobacillus sakei]